MEFKLEMDLSFAATSLCGHWALEDQNCTTNKTAFSFGIIITFLGYHFP